MITKILIVLGILLIVSLIIVALQPSEFRIARSAVIAAPPATVFAEVNDRHRWPAWSPWEKLDPAMKHTYEGPAAGAGAVSTWDGNKDVGAGRMTIIESRPSELIRMKLEFYEPMAAVSTAEFTFQPPGTQTAVTWSMAGTNSFISRAFCLFVNMDKMVGGQFEQGLANLKTLTETVARK